MTPGRVAALTAGALACFAANSLLCRAALGGGLVDPITFMVVRIVSGAAALWVGMRVAGRRPPSGGSPGSALVMLAYAVPFSLAYVRIGAGVGALIIFGVTQLAMVGWAALRGARPRPHQLAGIVIALAGLASLAVPGASAPDLAGAVLMLLAGVAWGAYSLRGATARDSTATTAHNFLLATPLALVLGAASLPGARWTPAGLALAAASGAVASGGGYSLWYAVMPFLGATRAAAVQLAVPVLAGLGATALLGERLTARVALAGAAILAGIWLAMRRRPGGPAAGAEADPASHAGGLRDACRPIIERVRWRR
jgi:drug/metabolite transporter (DMT)-like permease